VTPELALVLGARLAEAAQAEGAELAGVLRIVRAPDGGDRVELAEAVPARDGVALGHDRRLDDKVLQIKAVGGGLTRFETL
jgi:hypothetical protein